MLCPVFVSSTSGLLIRTSGARKHIACWFPWERGRPARCCRIRTASTWAGRPRSRGEASVLNARALDRTCGDPADEDADDDGDNTASDVDDLRDRRCSSSCRLRRRAAGEDECRRGRNDAEEGGQDVAPERDRGQSERVVHPREGEDDREADEEDDLHPFIRDGAIECAKLLVALRHLLDAFAHDC